MREDFGENFLKRKKLDKFVSLHVHKCGGTTFAVILQDIYGDKFFWDKSEDSVQIHGRIRRYNIGHVAQSTCVHGHINVSKYAQLRRPYITWLRHPVTRMESEFSILKQKRLTSRSSPLHRHIILDEWTFEDYCREHHNVYKNYLEDLRVRDFAFIGIMEKYEESLFVLSQVIGHKIPPYYQRNVRIMKRQWFKEGTLEEKNMCRQLNRKDIAFYELAKRRLANEFKCCLPFYESGVCSPKVKR